MSIIHGIINLNNTAYIPHDIGVMVQAGSYLGPDGAGTWPDSADMSVDGGIRRCVPAIFAFNLLRALPASRYENMPLYDKEAGLVIVADARIDNRDELCEALGIPKDMRQGMSDARIILSAYKKWQDNCAIHLLGDFAFAVWDERKKKLFLARDIFGIRPLYYHLSNQVFIFSSSIRSMLADKNIPDDLDEKHFADKLCGLTCDDDSTLHKGIKRVLPGHIMTVENRKINMGRYWKPGESKEIRYSKDSDYVEKYLDIFTEAIRCRLASYNGRVGSFLSGGIDSPSICAVATSLLREKGDVINTYSFVLSEKEMANNKDERRYIELMHNIDGISGHFITSDIFPENHSELLNLFKYTSNVKPGYPSTALSMAKEQKIRVMLDGYGGDQCATYRGRGPVYESLWKFNTKLFYRHVKAMSDYDKTSLIRAMVHVFRLFLKNIDTTNSGSDLMDFIYKRQAISSEFAERIDILNRARLNSRFNRRDAAGFKEMMVNMLINERDFGDSQDSFAVFHCEKRLPMFDRRLIEYCLSIPPEQLFFGMNRRLIRRAMAGILPDELRLRDGKTIANTPGMFNIIYEDIGFYRNILKKARSIPPVSRYIDLDKLHNRLEHILADVMKDGEHRKFMIGPTTRGFAMTDWLNNYFSGKKKEESNIPAHRKDAEDAKKD